MRRREGVRGSAGAFHSLPPKVALFFWLDDVESDERWGYQGMVIDWWARQSNRALRLERKDT